MTRRPLLFLSLLALAAPQFISFALQQPAGAPAQPAGFGTIQGTIVREGTSDPIPDVQITITGRGGMTAQEAQAILNVAARGGVFANLPAEVLQNAQDSVRGGQSGLTAVSDSAGQFTIQNVPVGTQTVRAQLEGYFGGAVNGTYPQSVALPITVTKDQTSNIKISMLPGGTITGRVFDPAGKPSSENPVQILQPAYQNGVLMLQPADLRQTDDRGEFRLYRLPPGEYYLAAGPRFQLPGLQANVGPQETATTTFFPNVTDPSAATRITLRSGDDLTGINIQLRTVQGTTVSGRVTSTVPPGPTTNPQGQARLGGVILVPTDSNGVLNLNPGSAISLQPDGGTFEFKNVTPGTYDVVARMSTARGGGWGPQAPPATATGPWAVGRVAIDTRRGNLDNIAVVVKTGMDLKGRVLLDGTPARANVRISLQPEGIQNLNDQQLNLMFNQIRQYAAPIADDGSFLIPLIPEGRYRIQVSLNAPAGPAGRGAAAQAAAAAAAAIPSPPPLPANAYLADIRQGGTSVYDNGLRVGGEQPNPIDVLVNTSGGSIEGNVLGADQKPVAAMTVILVPPDERRQNALLYKNTRSDPEGHFIMQNVPPGRYTLYAWEVVPPGAWQNAEFMSRYVGRGVSVNVQPGTRATANVTAIRSGL